MEITDEMCRRALEAQRPDRIQGFSTRLGYNQFGAPYYIRDVFRAPGEQEIWRGDDHDEMLARCEIERMRLGLAAALQS